MTTPWISRPRWTCKYCNVTINDDVPSRTHHENGLRHKGNVERSLREAYKKSQREKSDEQHAKREMAKIERLAQERHAQDDVVSVRRSEGSAASTLGDKKSKQPSQWKPAGSSTAYGYALPVFGVDQERKGEEERIAKEQEAEVAKRKEGVAGEWQTVVEPIRSTHVETKLATRGSATAVGQPSTSSSFKVRERQGIYGDYDDDDLELDTIKVKKRSRPLPESGALNDGQGATHNTLPQWTPLRLETGVSAKDEGVKAIPVQKMQSSASEQNEAVKIEDSEDQSENAEVKQNLAVGDDSGAAASSSSSMFKKRKAGSGAGAKKVRAII